MKRFLFALCMMAFPSWAALPTTTVFEVHQGGSNLNGGCFITGASGTDYSQQNAAQYTFADLAIDAATNTKVTSGISLVAREVLNPASRWRPWMYGYVQPAPSSAPGTATVRITSARQDARVTR